MNRSSLLALAIILLGRPAPAQTFTWSGLGSDNHWSTTGNWQGGAAPASGSSTAVVMSGTTQTVNVLNLGGFQLNSLTFAADAGAFTIGQANGDYFNFFPTGGGSGPSIGQFSAAGQTINLPNSGIELNGDLTLGGTGSGGLAIVGQIISPTTPGRLILTGPYSVTLTGQNTSSGITVNAGILRLTNDVAFGSGALIFGGGTLQLINNLAVTRSLIVNAGGGTIDANGFTGSMTSSFTVTGAGQLAFTNTALRAGGATVSAQLQQTGGLLVTGTNDTVTLRGTNSYSGPTLVTGGATLAIDADGRLGNTSGTTIDGGTLALVYPSGFTTTRPFELGPGGGTIGIDSSVAPTAFSGVIGGSGGLAKTGTGVITLSGSNAYSGGTSVAGGTLAVTSDAALGTGNVSGTALGTLAFTGTTATVKSFAMGGGTITVASGRAVTFNGGQVSAAYLDGAGTFATGPSGATFVNVTTTPSVAVASNSPADTFRNVTNSAALTIAPGLNTAGTSTNVTFNSFTNQGLGSISISASSRVNAANFQSYGTLTLSPGTGANPTQLTNFGAAPLSFNAGSRTFISIPAHANPNQFDAGIDLHGQNAVVAGGLFVNNGYVVDSVGAGTKTVIADFGSLVKGAGFYQNSVQTVNGGKFQSGNSPGKASFGSFTFGPGGVSNYIWAIDDAAGTAGPSPDANGQVSGWGLVNVVKRSLGGTTTTGDFAWTATAANKLTVSLDTLLNPTTVGTDIAGPMADFDPAKPYSWLAASWAGNYSGPTDPAALSAATAFDASGFQNPIAGTFGWRLDAGGHSLSLTYTPTAVPEPGTLALTAVGAICWATFWRRRWLSGGPAATLSA